MAIGLAKYGSEELLKTKGIMHLYEVYVQINKDKKVDPTVQDEALKFFHKMETGDAEALKTWEKLKTISLDYYKTIYTRLGIDFDEWSGESLQVRSNSLLTL